MEDKEVTEKLLKYVKSKRKPVFNKKGAECGYTSRQIRRLTSKIKKKKRV